MSSTLRDRKGRSSDISMPHRPRFLNSKGEGIRVPMEAICSTSLVRSRPGGCPSYFFSVGLGSNRSIWLGPPFMKRWITDLARGSK